VLMSGMRDEGRGELGRREGEGRDGATLNEVRDPRGLRYRPLILDQNMPSFRMLFSTDPD